MKKTLYLLILYIMAINSLYAQNEDFLFLVEQSIKAPSGHNTQPWLFRINKESVEIHPNFEKTLPVVDPHNRELFISLGCATENLCLAATYKSYKPTVSVNSAGIITIKLTKTEGLTSSPLFQQIEHRQTNRRVYNGSVITEDEMNYLKAITLEEKIKLHFFARGTADFDSIASYVYRGNTQQMHDSQFKQELQSWMRYNKKHQNKTNDGLSYAVFGAPNLPQFIAKPIIKKAVNETSQNKGDKKKIESSSHLVLFTTTNNTLDEWINLGRSLERFLLLITQQGIAHAYLNQPNEIQSLSIDMAEMLELNEYPTILLRLGYAKKMPYSKRKSTCEVLIND